MDIDQKYIIQPSKIHGRGLFAIEDIPVGTKIIQERDIWPSTAETIQDDLGILSSFRKLRPQARDAILMLSGGFRSAAEGTKAINTASKKDAAAMLRKIYMRSSQVDQGGEFCMYKEIAMVNHSCYPNVELLGDGETGWGRLVAITEIQEGDELVMNYAQPFWTHGQRGAFLREIHHIMKCGCRVCSLPKEKRKKSNERRNKLEEGSVKLEAFATELSKPKTQNQAAHLRFQAVEVLELAENMMGWAEQEGIAGADLMKVYDVASNAAQSLGQTEKGKTYGLRMMEMGQKLGVVKPAQARALRKALTGPSEETAMVKGSEDAMNGC